MLEKIIKLMNIENPSLDDRLELLEELYWADWKELEENYPEYVVKVFIYLKSSDLTIAEKAKVLSLYNNMEGAYIQEFAEIIANFYKEDRIKFLKALHLNIDEVPHLVYIFRAMEIFEEGEEEFNQVQSENQLNEEELDSAYTFFKTYKTICST